MAGKRVTTRKRGGRPKPRQVTFRRLPSGEWGLSGPRALMISGRQVSVHVKNGKTLTKRVGRMVRVQGDWMVTTIGTDTCALGAVAT